MQGQHLLSVISSPFDNNSVCGLMSFQNVMKFLVGQAGRGGFAQNISQLTSINKKYM